MTILTRNIGTLFLLLTVLVAPSLNAASTPKVKTVSVQKMLSPPRLALTGIITNRNEFDVIAAVDGHLSFIREPGESVVKGELIARLDDALLSLEVKELTANIQRQKIHYAFYTKELLRLTTLKQTESVSQSARDEMEYQQDLAKNQIQILENQLAKAKVQLARASISAPTDGVLSSRNRRQGEYLESGALLGHFLANNSLEGQVRVPVRYASFLQLGQTIQVTDDLQDKAAIIQAIIPRVDERSQTMLVRFSIDEKMQRIWHTGQQLKVRIPSMRQSALIVPRDALLVEAERSFVMLVSSDTKRLKKVEVSVGYGEGDSLAVHPIESNTLNIGDQIVIRGERLLAEGTQVSIEHLY